ncbi:MAG: nucleotidyltransferase family protein, partial [Microcystaceae cyanobacterium]
FLESAFYQRSYDFIRNDGQVAVELHWGLTGKNFPYPVEFQDLWSRIQFVSVDNTEVPNLCSEDLLLYLCVHGARHCWEELKWSCDLAELLHTHQGLDWDWILEQSRILGVERLLWLGLLLTHELLGTTFPENVLQKMQADRTAQVLAWQVRERLFDSPLTDVEKHFFLVQVRERLLDKALYLRHLILTPSGKEWALLPLPQFLFFFYYLLRPVKLLFDVCRLRVSRSTKIPPTRSRGDIYP